MKRFVAIAAVFAGVSLMSAASVLAQDEAPKSGCASFTWDVSHELAVLDGPSKPITASADAKKPVRIELDQRYAVKLMPLGSVRFVAKPGKSTLESGEQAGMLSFHTQRAGRYRVSLTTGHWFDLVDNGNFVVSRELQGQRDCEKVHKIVEFELSGNRDFVLQLSGATESSLAIAVTQVKPGQP